MVNYVERVQPRTLLSSILGLDETYYACPLTLIPSPTSPAVSATELPSQDPLIPTPESVSVPHISFINGAASAHALRLPGAQSFSLSFSDPAATGKSASVSDPDLSKIPPEYDFADVFSKGKADTLPPHRPYDLKIDLEDGASRQSSRCTPSLSLRWELLEISSTNTSVLGSYDLRIPSMVHLFYSFVKRTAPSDSVSTSEV